MYLLILINFTFFKFICLIIFKINNWNFSKISEFINTTVLLKFISFNAKKARGLLTKFVINNKIISNNDLKDFNLENYKFDMSLSDESTFVFTR